MKPKSISVVIVTWNSEKDIADCLESLERQTYKHIDSVIVVDNNSTDETTHIIKERYSAVTLLQQDENHYFTGGNNIGIRFALLEYGSDYVALLNPDTIAEPSWIEESVRVLEHDNKAGVVGPKVLYWNERQKGRINSAGMIFDGFLHAYDRGDGEVDTGKYEQQVDVPALSGVALVVRREVFEQAGLFWERLRMYLEDVELSLRVRKAGWRLVYTPKAIVKHKHMSSTNQNKLVRRRGWLMRNFVLIALRHYSFKKKLAMLKKWIQYKMNKNLEIEDL